MKKYIFIIINILIILSSVNPIKPKWVESFGIITDYNDNKYLTGFGISPEKGSNSENLESAKAFALRDLSSSIRTRIVSTLELQEEEKNDEATSMAKVNIQTTVFLNISGIKTYEKYYDKKDKLYYALCVIDRDTFLKDLEIQKKELFEEYKSRVNLINNYINKNDSDNATKAYQESNEILEKINQNYLVENYLNNGKINLDELYKLFEIKNSFYEKLKKTEPTTFEEAANLFLSAFDKINFKNKTFIFIPAYYKTTQVSSEFFYYFAEYCKIILEKKGAREQKIENETSQPDYIFKGSYYDTKNGYKILYSLTNSNNNSISGISEIALSEKFVTSSGFKILPDNIDIVLKDNKVFNQTNADDKKIQIKVWTNKGLNNPIFKEGEVVEFYVQVNRSGYISILYHLAGKDRIRTPLLENYYIPNENVYKAIKIDETFIVYPPFGCETAQIFFSTEPQDLFLTKSVIIDGEKYDILADDFNDYITKKRGLKKNIKQESAETFLSITTISK